MRGYLLKAMLFCAILLALAGQTPVVADSRVRMLGGGEAGWDGWIAAGGAWSQVTGGRAQDPCPGTPHWESLHGGESATGSLRSPDFVIQGDLLRFFVNGWDGRWGDKTGNSFTLRSCEEGTVLRRSAPPKQDAFSTYTWLVTDLRGRMVHFEASDIDHGSGFAWLGLALLEEEAFAGSQRSSPYRALRMPAGFGTWGILRYDGARRKTPAYLSSLAGGETGTGTIESPSFTLSVAQIRLMVRGHAGERGERKSNWVALADAATDETLRSSPPPMSDFPKEIVWDVSGLRGRKVCIRLIDTDSDQGFAWMGLDSVDAGSNFRADFGKKPSLEGWQAISPEAQFITRDGIPFIIQRQPPLSEGGAYRMPLGFKARRLLLLGMTNSLDVGCPVWADPRQTLRRFWLGDRLGELRIAYADGIVQTYPLTLGESLWWGRRFSDFPEPFKSDPAASKVLAASLRLYPPEPVGDGYFMAAIAPRPAKMAAIEFVDNPRKEGVPIIVGVSVQVAGGENVPGGVAVPTGNPPAAVCDFIEHRTLRAAGVGEKEAQRRLSALRHVLYTTEDDFREPVHADIPEGYRGPRVSFKGNAYADVLTGVFHHNLHDIDRKVTQDGMYHTSTKDAPSWGGYEGFGTYKDGVQSYYSTCWTRDMGRSMGELAALGYWDKCKLTADYVLLLAKAWQVGKLPEMNLIGEVKLDLDGRRLPPHVCRILNSPNTTPGQGCFENDGHGMTGLFLYNLWRRIPDREQWLRACWQDVQYLGDWVVWQLAHPDVSGATETLRTDSECAGGIGHSVYADMAQMEMLQGLAQMADSIGRKEKGEEWRRTAERLRRGIAKEYAESDPKYGTVWTRRNAGWPNQSTVLGPLIFLADRRGFAPEDDDPQWRPISEATYRRLTDSYPNFGYYGVAMGYGQGFVTQGALLLDRMKDASIMLEWAAKCIYCKQRKPFIVPEGCELHPSGDYWHRTGDLGNGVQEGEIVKALRLVIGLDDNRPERLRVMPRMPYGWSEIRVEGMPAMVPTVAGWEVARLAYVLSRNAGGMRLELRSDRPLPEMTIRLGPFAASPRMADGYLNGQAVRATWAKSGDSWWSTLAVPRGSEGLVAQVLLPAKTQ